MGKLSAIILAADYSSRMERLKALLLLSNKTVIERSEILAGYLEQQGYKGCLPGISECY